MKLDVLQRDDFIEKLMSIISNLSERRKGCCFAIDGKWGIGKTYVLDSLEMKLREIQCEETTDNKYFVFNYNCWQYDYYSEPSIAIISAMLNTAEESLSYFSLKADSKIKGIWSVATKHLGEIAGKFVENKIGINVVDIYNEINGKCEERENKKKEFDSLFAFKKTLDETRVIMQKIATEKTLIIVVDELDRCIPHYAIKVLERLHHIFEGLNNIIVIVAIDKEQLSHSIKEIYGNKTEVDGYLKKFIDFTLSLDEGKMSDCYLDKYSTYISKFKDADKDERAYIEDVLFNIFKGIEIRTQEKIMEKAELIHSLISTQKEDIALMVCEIMVIRYNEIRNGNLYWLPEINRSTYLGLDEILGKEHVEYLKQLGKKVGNGRIIDSGGKHYPAIGTFINDKVFWILSQIYSKEAIFFIEDLLRYKNEVESAKEFSDLVRYMV